MIRLGYHEQKSLRNFVLCPSKRHFMAFFLASWFKKTALTFSHIFKKLKTQIDKIQPDSFPMNYYLIVVEKLVCLNGL